MYSMWWMYVVYARALRVYVMCVGMWCMYVCYACTLGVCGLSMYVSDVCMHGLHV